MGGGVDEAALGAADREAQRVVDHALPARPRRSGRGRGRSGGRPRRRRSSSPGRRAFELQVEDGAGPRRPRGAAALRVGGEELVELAGGVVDHEHVAVAVARRAALDRRVAAGSGTARGRSRRRTRSSPAPWPGRRRRARTGCRSVRRPRTCRSRGAAWSTTRCSPPTPPSGCARDRRRVGVPRVVGREVRTACARRRGRRWWWCGGDATAGPRLARTPHRRPPSRPRSRRSERPSHGPSLDIGRSRPDPEPERDRWRRDVAPSSIYDPRSGGEARTPDNLINSQTLYQLSYPGSISAGDDTMATPHPSRLTIAARRPSPSPLGA